MKDISINKQMCKHVYIIIIIIILACIQVHMLTLLVIACNQNWPCFFFESVTGPKFCYDIYFICTKPSWGMLGWEWLAQYHPMSFRNTLVLRSEIIYKTTAYIQQRSKIYKGTT